MTDVLHEDVAAVQSVFDQWALYRKCVDRNFLFHREAYAMLADFVRDRMNRPFAFLDCGCGDAAFSVASLRGSPVSRFVGIDLSEKPLELARANARALGCDCEFRQGDFFRLIAEGAYAADLVWIGLSLHHLPGEEKRRFLADCRRALDPEGHLLIFEPCLRRDESREEYLARWDADRLAHWSSLTPEEAAYTRQHVMSSDYPESFEQLAAWAREVGYRDTHLLYTTPNELYAVMAFDG